MMVRKPLTPQAALMRAESLCARAEHSSGEIRKKLEGWGISRIDAARILDSLVSRRYVDDARFAAAFVRDKVEYAGWGRRKIALALYQKGVSRDVSACALDDIDPDRYEERLREIVDRKRRSLLDGADTYEGRTRIFRHAASRGFEPELIARILRETSRGDAGLDG